MCEPVTIATAAVGAASAYTSQQNKNKAWAASEEARRKQQIEAVRQSNVADAGLQLQNVSNFDEARESLSNHSLDSIKAQGSVQTAVAESMLSGNSVDRVVRDNDNILLRSKGQITENYERDYLNIYTQRESNRDNLIATLNNSAPIPRPSNLEGALSIATSAAQGAQMGSGLNSTIKKSASKSTQ